MYKLRSQTIDVPTSFVNLSSLDSQWGLSNGGCTTTPKHELNDQGSMSALPCDPNFVAVYGLAPMTRPITQLNELIY